jgi:CubicO group peptidase (beta-lactamase class C family)
MLGLASLLGGANMLATRGVRGESAGQLPPPLLLDAPLDELIARLARLIPSVLNENHVPGVSVALIRESKTVWTGLFGRRSVATLEPVEMSTMFEAASLTKPVFATGLMALVEQGGFDLDRPLGDYGGLEPGLDENLRAHMGRLTARLVLTHRTGLPNWRSQQGLQFLHDADAVWSYSGEGYVLLQRVVESVTGQPMEDFLRDRVLIPLGMKRTRFTWRSAEALPFAESHSYKGESRGKREWPVAVSASSIHTTPTDFAQFMKLFLDPAPEASPEDVPPRLLSRGALAEMLSPQTEVDDPAVAGRIAWGLGWGLQQSIDGTAFWHWGSNQGFKSFCLGYPAQRLGVVIFTNADLGWKVHRAVVPELIGGDQTALMWKM